jgi:hypothetical protein
VHGTGHEHGGTLNLQTPSIAKRSLEAVKAITTPVERHWHRQPGSALLCPSASCRCPVMPKPAAAEASDDVLLQRDTGSALYTTRATEQDIHRANSSLSKAGQRSRFVAARYLMHHQSGQES